MRYNNSEIKYTLSGKPYYRRKNYPQIPYSDSDVYVITTIGDRLDTIAYSYYNNAELWWVISVANNNITKGSMFPEPGTQLRIPIDVNSVLNLFDAENNI
jgi:nucleoid-associated protein YgaU